MHQHRVWNIEGIQYILTGKKETWKRGRDRRRMKNRVREGMERGIKKENYKANKWSSDFITLLRFSSLLPCQRNLNWVISQHTPHTHTRTNSITFGFYLSRENWKNQILKN